VDVQILTTQPRKFTSEDYHHNGHLCKTVIPGTIVKLKGFILHKATH